MSTTSASIARIGRAASASPRFLAASLLLPLFCSALPASAKERAAQPATSGKASASTEASRRGPKPRKPAFPVSDSSATSKAIPRRRDLFAHESTPCRDSALEALRRRVLDALFREDSGFFAQTIDSGTAIEFHRLDESYCESRSRFPPRFQLHCAEAADSLAHFLSPRFRVRARRTEAGWVLDRTLACVPGEIRQILQELIHRAEEHDTGYLNPLFGKNLGGLNPFQMAGTVLHSGINADPYRMCWIDGDDSIRLAWPMCDMSRHWDHKAQFDFRRSEGRWRLTTIWKEDGCR